MEYVRSEKPGQHSSSFAQHVLLPVNTSCSKDVHAKSFGIFKECPYQIETELEKTQNDAKPSTWAGPSTSTQLSHTAQDNFR